MTRDKEKHLRNDPWGMWHLHKGKIEGTRVEACVIEAIKVDGEPRESNMIKRKRRMYSKEDISKSCQMLLIYQGR